MVALNGLVKFLLLHHFLRISYLHLSLKNNGLKFIQSKSMLLLSMTSLFVNKKVKRIQESKKIKSKCLIEFRCIQDRELKQFKELRQIFFVPFLVWL